MLPTIDLDSVVSISEDQISRELDMETCIMNTAAGMFYGVDQVGMRIWQLLHERISVAAICQQLEQEYQVTPAQCREDVLTFLAKLAEQGLITVN